MKKHYMLLSLLCILTLVIAGCGFPGLPNFGKVNGVDVTAKVTSPPLELGDAGTQTTVSTGDFTTVKGLAFVNGQLVETEDDTDEVQQFKSPDIQVPQELKGNAEQALSGIEAIRFDLDLSGSRALDVKTIPVYHIAVRINDVIIIREIYDGPNELLLTTDERTQLTNLIQSVDTFTITITTDIPGLTSFTIDNVRIQGVLTAALSQM